MSPTARKRNILEEFGLPPKLGWVILLLGLAGVVQGLFGINIPGVNFQPSTGSENFALIGFVLFLVGIILHIPLFPVKEPPRYRLPLALFLCAVVLVLLQIMVAKKTPAIRDPVPSNPPRQDGDSSKPTKPTPPPGQKPSPSEPTREPGATRQNLQPPQNQQAVTNPTGPKVTTPSSETGLTGSSDRSSTPPAAGANDTSPAPSVAPPAVPPLAPGPVMDGSKRATLLRSSYESVAHELRLHERALIEMCSRRGADQARTLCKHRSENVYSDAAWVRLKSVFPHLDDGRSQAWPLVDYYTMVADLRSVQGSVPIEMRAREACRDRQMLTALETAREHLRQQMSELPREKLE